MEQIERGMSPAHERAWIETVMFCDGGMLAPSPAHERAWIETAKPQADIGRLDCRPLTSGRGLKLLLRHADLGG